MTQADKEKISHLREICIRRGQIAPQPGDKREEAIAREAQDKRRAA